MKAKLTSMSSDLFSVINKKEIALDEIVEQITKILSEKHLNYRQAVAVLEAVQAEIKECMLYY